MKRITALLILLVMVIMTSSMASASDKDIPRWSPKTVDENTYQVVEDENNLTYHDLTKFNMDFYDQLGYWPQFDVDYANQVVTYTLFKNKVEIPCLIDQLSHAVLLPDFELPKEIIEKNNLKLLVPNDEGYNNIIALQLIGCKFEEVDDNGKKLRITAKKGEQYIVVTSWDYFEDEGYYYVSDESFRQMLYEIYRI